MDGFVRATSAGRRGRDRALVCAQLCAVTGDRAVAAGPRHAAVPGAVYELTFAFSARPSTGASDDVMEVRFGGERVAVVSDDGSRAQDTNWRVSRYRFIATRTVSRLEFRDLGVSNSLGTYLDGVSLVRVR